MYNDYPTVYQSNLNENLIYLIILGVVAFILLIICLISLSKIYKKANRSAISAWIPVYNLWVLLEIVDLPVWYLVLLFIPFVNIWVFFQIMEVLATSFRKGKNYAIELLLLPFIFLPILAFSDIEYIGINMAAMEGKSQAVDIPNQIEQEESPTVNEEVDEASRNINISIGGGVYQKDYTNTLLQVDEGKTISDTGAGTITQTKKTPLTFSNISFLDSIEEEEIPVVEEEPKEMSILFPEQSQKPKEMQSVSEIVPNPITTSDTMILQANNSTNTEIIESNINQQPTTVEQVKSIPDYIVCPKCGAKVNRDAKACFLCGRSLD